MFEQECTNTSSQKSNKICRRYAQYGSLPKRGKHCLDYKIVHFHHFFVCLNFYYQITIVSRPYIATIIKAEEAVDLVPATSTHLQRVTSPLIFVSTIESLFICQHSCHVWHNLYLSPTFFLTGPLQRSVLQKQAESPVFWKKPPLRYCLYLVVYFSSTYSS